MTVTTTRRQTRAAALPGEEPRHGDPAVGHTDRQLEITDYPPAEWDVWVSGYGTGYGHGHPAGYAEGYAAAEAAMAAAHAHLAGSIQKVAGEPSHEHLVERRRRHQLGAVKRTRQAAEPWPKEAAG